MFEYAPNSSVGMRTNSIVSADPNSFCLPETDHNLRDNETGIRNVLHEIDGVVVYDGKILWNEHN